jgi:hypothetical protein
MMKGKLNFSEGNKTFKKGKKYFPVFKMGVHRNLTFPS